MNGVKHYVELLTGERKPASWHIVEALVRLHGYRYVLREPNLEVVAK